MPRVFVYGTLKEGLSNAAKLDGAAFERAAVTVNGFVLHMVEGYPAMSRAAEGVVHGELYTVSEEHLARLDVFEGVPEWYQREVIELEDGTRADAYVLPTERIGQAPRIAGGRFRE